MSGQEEPAPSQHGASTALSRDYSPFSCPTSCTIPCWGSCTAGFLLVTASHTKPEALEELPGAHTGSSTEQVLRNGWMDGQRDRRKSMNKICYHGLFPWETMILFSQELSTVRTCEDTLWVHQMPCSGIPMLDKTSVTHNYSPETTATRGQPHLCFIGTQQTCQHINSSPGAAQERGNG